MSHSGLTMQYYDPEDQALLRRRAAREHAAQHGHGHAHPPPAAPPAPPVPAFQEPTLPPAGYVQTLLGNDAPVYDPNVDAFTRGIDVTREAAHVRVDRPVRGRAGAACAPSPESPRTSQGPSESDLMGLDGRELVQWIAMCYLPARFSVWMAKRRRPG